MGKYSTSPVEKKMSVLWQGAGSNRFFSFSVLDRFQISGIIQGVEVGLRWATEDGRPRRRCNHISFEHLKSHFVCDKYYTEVVDEADKEVGPRRSAGADHFRRYSSLIRSVV
jgi:hypothetical protein